MKQFFLAEELGTGLPDVQAGTAFNNGDICYNIDWTPGTPLGWIYDQGIWYKFGVSDSEDIKTTRFGGTTHFGLGEAADASNRLRVNGNTTITGDLDVTGKYGCVDNYALATGIANSNNGVMYNGDGSTSSFAITAGHSAYSLLVFLNGVCQVPGVDYTVTCNAVVFSVGTPPATGDKVQIRELVI